MDVHEDFRNCLIAELMLKLNDDTHAVQNVVSVFDSLLNDFDVHRKEKQLVVYQNPIPKLVQLYLSIKELEGLSKGTIDAYRLGLYRFFLFCNKQPEEVAPADIRNWVLYIRSTGRVCDRTLNGYIGIIEYFYNWALRLGYVQKVPTAVIPKIKYEKKTGRIIRFMYLVKAGSIEMYSLMLNVRWLLKSILPQEMISVSIYLLRSELMQDSQSHLQLLQ